MNLAEKGILELMTLMTQTQGMGPVAVVMAVLQESPLAAVVLLWSAVLATHQGAAIIVEVEHPGLTQAGQAVSTGFAVAAVVWVVNVSVVVSAAAAAAAVVAVVVAAVAKAATVEGLFVEPVEPVEL